MRKKNREHKLCYIDAKTKTAYFTRLSLFKQGGKGWTGTPYTIWSGKPDEYSNDPAPYRESADIISAYIDCPRCKVALVDKSVREINDNRNDLFWLQDRLIPARVFRAGGSPEMLNSFLKVMGGKLVFVNKNF